MSARSKARQTERFAALMQAQGPGLARVVRGYVGAADRDDLEQEVALAIWRALPRFRGDCSERTFAFRIAHNRCIDYLRRRRFSIAPDAEVDRMQATAAPADAQMAQQQRQRALQAAVARLPIRYRQVLMLALEDMPHAEIAAVLGIAVNTVSVRLSRARRMLRDRLRGASQ